MWDEGWHSQTAGAALGWDITAHLPLCSQPCPSAFGTGMSLPQQQGLGGVSGEGLTAALGVAGDG